MVAKPKKRQNPNILVTGTPGVGKSTFCQALSAEANLTWYDVSNLAKENNFLENYSEEYRCPILDEDKLLDYLEEKMTPGGNIVEYHSCDFFPERWFDIVFVLRTDNTILYDRLVERGYSGKKLEDNVSCEIFQTALEEANRSYTADIVVELKSSNSQQMDDNVTCVIGWVNWWRHNNAEDL